MGDQRTLTSAARSQPTKKWIGRPVFDASGHRIGHVQGVDGDALGNAWLDVRAEWGVLDWLSAIGCGGGPRFRFYSDDVEEQGAELHMRASQTC